ncbi:MAG: hypothetical protein HY347_06105 [candidate division NC10 bacterium]|nr:hypothetical protein [candidate division NC10 bacterium]
MSVVVFEDFIEKPDKLEVRSGSAGTPQRVDGAGGIIEIPTSASQNSWTQMQSRSRFITARHAPVVTAFLRSKDYASSQEIFVGLADGEAGSSPDMIGFYRSDGANAGTWRCRTKAAGVGNGDVDSGFLGDLQEVELALAASPLEVTFLVNGRVVHVEKTNIPTALMRVVLWIKTTTSAVRTLAVDYIGVLGGR